MIEVSYTETGWRIVFRMDGVRCTVLETLDRDLSMYEIRQKMSLMRGLYQGKTWAVKEGKDI